MGPIDLIVCRCEGITETAIRQAIDECGASSPNEVKLVTRAGKGICQGRCCGDLVARILAARTGRGVGEMPPPSVRPPVRAVPAVCIGAAPDATGRLDGNVLTLQTRGEDTPGY